MAAVDFIKFTAMLVITLTGLRLLQDKIANTEAGKALGYILR